MSDQSTNPPDQASAQPPYAEDSVDLIELVRILWKRKLIIVAIAAVFGGIAVAASFLMTPKYDASILIQPVDRSQGSAASSLAGRFGGIAALAGISLDGSGDDTKVAIATLKSRHLVTSFIEEEGLLPVLFDNDWDAEKGQWILNGADEPPSLWDGHKLFKKDVMRVSEDPETGLVTLSISWSDPKIGVAWTNALVARANTYLQEKAKMEADKNLSFLREKIDATNVTELRASLSDMITSEMERAMLAHVSSEYAFKVVDPSVEPDLDDFTSPNRLLMAVLGVLLGGMLVMFAVLYREMRSARNEPVGN